MKCIKPCQKMIIFFFKQLRRKDAALINFLIKIDKDHPKFHIRVMLPPKIKFKGFFYFLREIDKVLKEKRAFLYTCGVIITINYS